MGVSRCKTPPRILSHIPSLSPADDCIPGEWFGRLESLMSDGLSPQLKQEECFSRCCVCCEGSGRRAQADDLGTGSSLPNHCWGNDWNDRFPAGIFSLKARRVGSDRGSSENRCNAVRCHRHGEAPGLTKSPCICVCASLRASECARRSPGTSPTGYLTNVAGIEVRCIMRRPPESVGGCGWRQLRSGPRGKQKPERRNGDGKLTSEAGPALRAEVHGGYVVGGRKSRGGLVSARRDDRSVLVVSGEERFQLSGWKLESVLVLEGFWEGGRKTRKKKVGEAAGVG